MISKKVFNIIAGVVVAFATMFLLGLFFPSTNIILQVITAIGLGCLTYETLSKYNVKVCTPEDCCGGEEGCVGQVTDNAVEPLDSQPKAVVEDKACEAKAEEVKKPVKTRKPRRTTKSTTAKKKTTTTNKRRGRPRKKTTNKKA